MTGWRFVAVAVIGIVCIPLAVAVGANAIAALEVLALIGLVLTED